MGNVNQTPQHNPYAHPDQQHIEDHQEQLSSSSSSSSSSSTTTFTCEICIEPMTLLNEKFRNSNKCVHPFCTDCIITYIQVKLEDNVSDIKCPSLNCDHSLDPLSCRPKIPQQVFDKWCDVLCESCVLRFDSVYCPNRDCSALVVNECGNDGNLKRCLCPNCKQPFCFKCKVAWHAGFRCEESGETRDVNDITFGVLFEEKKWMRCPVCRHCVERNEGCNIIHCRCGIIFCYKCGEELGLRGCRCIRSSSCCTCCTWLFYVFLSFWFFFLLIKLLS